MNYAQLRRYDIANGEGVRTTLFVSGCQFACKGCFNRLYQDFNYGQPFTEDTLAQLLEYVSSPNVQGLSLLGGEIFMQDAETILHIVKTVKEAYPNKDIWCWTGYTIETLPASYYPILQYLDVLIDGQFIEELKDFRLRFRGSSNQRIIDVQTSIKENKIIQIKY